MKITLCPGWSAIYIAIPTSPDPKPLPCPGWAASLASLPCLPWLGGGPTHHSSLTTHQSSVITHHSPLITHHSSLITHHTSLITQHGWGPPTTHHHLCYYRYHPCHLFLPPTHTLKPAGPCVHSRDAPPWQRRPKRTQLRALKRTHPGTRWGQGCPCILVLHACTACCSGAVGTSTKTLDPRP